MELEVGSRARLSGCDLTESMLGSIEAATEDSPYTYENGKPYVGNVQTRYMLYHDDICNEWFTTAILKGNHKRSKWFLGTNLWFNWTDNHIMTINYAHEAAKNPKHLAYNGDMFYVHNTGGQFVEGSQSKVALFGQNQWNLSSRFTLRAGLRLEYSGIQGTAAHNLDGQVNNARSENWSLPNLLYFNPRWETFAGIDFTLNKNISCSLNVVNFLNEKGTSAGIQAASLSSDAAAFTDYLTSRTFLRPFTIEFSTNLRF